MRETFEDRYRQWKAFIAGDDAISLSSSDAPYVSNPQFEAIVELGEPAIPFILEKIRTDDDAHFLVHAIERITGKRFTPRELEEGGRRHGSPLGNQGYAALWEEWWRERGGSE